MTYAYRPTADRVHEQVALYEANPVMRIKDGDTYVAVASNGGASSNPSWCCNLTAHPEVSLQHGATVYRLRAREAHGEELARRGEARDPYIE